MCSFDINYKNYKIGNSFFDFHSLTNLKEIKIQNSKILTMNPETFKVLSYLNSNSNDTIKYSSSNSKSIKEQEEISSSSDEIKKDFKKFDFDIINNITNQIEANKFEKELINIESKLADLTVNFETKLELANSKIQTNETNINQFKQDINEQLNRIEKKFEHNINVKLDEINSNFEKQFDQFSDKLNGNFQNFFNYLQKQNNYSN